MSFSNFPGNQTQASQSAFGFGEWLVGYVTVRSVLTFGDLIFLQSLNCQLPKLSGSPELSGSLDALDLNEPDFERLNQIDQIANEDVEMKKFDDDSDSDDDEQAPESDYAAYLVIDTNIILHQFEVLSQFVKDVERGEVPVVIVVPGAVIMELDGQKKRDGLAWFARRGSSWLLQKVRERKCVKGQALEETLKLSGSWKKHDPGEITSSEMYNDNLILDCCMFFKERKFTLLCSADNNLCINAQTQGIPSITPSRFWSSRELAYGIYGDKVDLSQFGGHKESYKNEDRAAPVTAPAQAVDEDDRMQLDDEDTSETWKSEDPLNMLHEAVIDHFTRLLVELVGKVGGEEHYTLWSAQKCLEYLNGRKRVKAANPRAEVFLLRPREGGGGRPGKEWARKDWEVALDNLGDVGRTVVVLSSVTWYLAIAPAAYLSELEVPVLDNSTRWNATAHGQVERVQRIIHQTWKSETLPPRWRGISQACRDMMPDYEYKLWTDASSREFIAEYYPDFLDTFDNYRYPIQRADAIRYFVLHHFGGVYIDLDIGCLRPMDPLLVYPAILPKTIPVGVSNDLMFAEKGHPFLEQTIHNLINFDHDWILNYPTVMFSTGPMFLSAQYGLYTATHAKTALQDIRILPKSLYGKNAREDEAPHSFFSHFYGSSWHADDAAFIGFLGHWGKLLMWIGLFILIIGLIRLPSKQRRGFSRRIGGYDIVLPRLSRSGRWHFHLGRSSYSASSGTSTQLPSPLDSSEASSPIDTDVPLLHLPFDVETPSQEREEDAFVDPYAGRVHSPLVEAFRRVRSRVSSMAGAREEPPDTPVRGRSQPSRGVLFFLPAIFTQAPDIELQPAPPGNRSLTASRPVAVSSLPRHAYRSSGYPPEKERYLQPDLESGRAYPSSSNDEEEYASLIDLGSTSDGTAPIRTSVESRSRSSSSTTLTDLQPTDAWEWHS
ncbi:unnamed protein product [Cyclocybe aegerita]|uniref:PIN domain-containing protein n=1 Tax=Cyclocybe aegerita TaxID=1973307 RepID=A0A8S0VWX8_CYCAE|nr:unnamed protein product [Cyclocybe aegerita]